MRAIRNNMIISILLFALSLSSCSEYGQQRDNEKIEATTTAAETTAAEISIVTDSEITAPDETEIEDLHIGKEIRIPDSDKFSDDTEIYERWFCGSYEVTEQYNDVNNINIHGERVYCVINDYYYHEFTSDDSYIRPLFYHTFGCSFAEDDEMAYMYGINGGVAELLIRFKDEPDKIYSAYGTIVKDDGYYCEIYGAYDFISEEPQSLDKLCGSSINAIACHKIKNTFGDEFRKVFDEVLYSFTDENGNEWSSGGFASFPFGKIYLIESDAEKKYIELYRQLCNFNAYEEIGYNWDKIDDVTSYFHIEVWYDGENWQYEREITDWKPSESDSLIGTAIDISDELTEDFGIYENYFFGSYAGPFGQLKLDYESNITFRPDGFFEDEEKAVISGMSGGTGHYLILFKDKPQFLYEGETEEEGKCIIYSRYDRISSGGNKALKSGIHLNGIGLKKLFRELGGDFETAYYERSGDMTEDGVNWSSGGFVPFMYRDIILSDYNTNDGRIELILQYLNYTEYEMGGYPEIIPEDMFGYFKLGFVKRYDSWICEVMEKVDIADYVTVYSELDFSTDTELFNKYFYGYWEYIWGHDGEIDGECTYSDIFGYGSDAVTELAENDILCVMRCDDSEIGKKYFTIYKDEPEHIYAAYTKEGNEIKILPRTEGETSYSYTLKDRGPSLDFVINDLNVSYMGIAEFDKRYNGELKKAIDKYFHEDYIDENGEKWNSADSAIVGANRYRICLESDLTVRVFRRVINLNDITDSEYYYIPRMLEIVYELKRNSKNEPFIAEIISVNDHVEGFGLINESDIKNDKEQEILFREIFVSEWLNVKEHPFVGTDDLRINEDFSIDYIIGSDYSDNSKFEFIGVSEGFYETCAVMRYRYKKENMYVVMSINKHYPDLIKIYHGTGSEHFGNSAFPIRYNENNYVMYERRVKMPDGSFNFNELSKGKEIDLDIIREHFCGIWSDKLAEIEGSERNINIMFGRYGKSNLISDIKTAFATDFGWFMSLDNNQIYLILADKPNEMYRYYNYSDINYSQYFRLLKRLDYTPAASDDNRTFGQLDFLEFAENNGESFMKAVNELLNIRVADRYGVNWRRLNTYDGYRYNDINLVEKTEEKLVLDIGLFNEPYLMEESYFRAEIIKCDGEWELSDELLSFEEYWEDNNTETTGLSPLE